MSELEPVLHAIHFQAIGADGIPSAVRTEYLYIKAILVAKIWIDDNSNAIKTYSHSRGGVSNTRRLNIKFDFEPGDTNDDGRITKADLVGITKVIAKGGTQMQRVAGDGRVNVADIILQLKKVSVME